MKPSSIKRFLYRVWAEWQAAWQRVQDERRRHDDHDDRCVSVPFDPHCELLLAEERGKGVALRLAVSIEESTRLHGELARERRLTDTLGAILLLGVEEEGGQPVARLKLVAPLRRGFDS